MGFPGIVKTQGKDFNFFKKVTVTWANYGGGSTDLTGPDLIIPFSTQGVVFINEGSGIISVSLNGSVDHFELNSAGPNNILTFNDRVISLIWLKVKSGNASQIISVNAWSIR